jgi:hypothetical protein
MPNLRDLRVGKETRQAYYSASKQLHLIPAANQLEMIAKAPAYTGPQDYQRILELCKEAPEAALQYFPELLRDNNILKEAAFDHPHEALEYAIDYLDTVLIHDLAPHAPVQAIKRPDKISSKMLNELALLYPRAAIKHAWDKLSSTVFKQVTEMQPELAWKYAQDRLPKSFATRLTKITKHGQKNEFILQKLTK